MDTIDAELIRLLQKDGRASWAELAAVVRLTPPAVADTSFCRNEGRRQAETLYPDRAPNDALGLPRTSDDRRFPAEIRFYEQCMTRLGYVRASAAPAR